MCCKGLSIPNEVGAKAFHMGPDFAPVKFALEDIPDDAELERYARDTPIAM